MHEMTDDQLNFRCQECNGSVVFNTASTNPLLRCVCGTPVQMLQVMQNPTKNHSNLHLSAFNLEVS
jgi:hypothetical protein